MDSREINRRKFWKRGGGYRDGGRGGRGGGRGRGGGGGRGGGHSNSKWHLRRQTRLNRKYESLNVMLDKYHSIVTTDDDDASQEPKEEIDPTTVSTITAKKIYESESIFKQIQKERKELVEAYMESAQECYLSGSAELDTINDASTSTGEPPISNSLEQAEVIMQEMEQLTLQRMDCVHREKKLYDEKVRQQNFELEKERANSNPRFTTKVLDDVVDLVKQMVFGDAKATSSSTDNKISRSNSDQSITMEQEEKQGISNSLEHHTICGDKDVQYNLSKVKGHMSNKYNTTTDMYIKLVNHQNDFLTTVILSKINPALFGTFQLNHLAKLSALEERLYQTHHQYHPKVRDGFNNSLFVGDYQHDTNDSFEQLHVQLTHEFYTIMIDQCAQFGSKTSSTLARKWLSNIVINAQHKPDSNNDSAKITTTTSTENVPYPKPTLPLMKAVLKINTYIRRHAKKITAFHARSVLTKMEEYERQNMLHLAPDTESYNDVLKCYLHSLQGLLLDDSKKHPLSISSCPQHRSRSDLNFAIKIAKDVEQMLESMKNTKSPNKSCEPDGVTYNHAIAIMAMSGDPTLSKKATKLLEWMETRFTKGERHMTPTITAYNATFVGMMIEEQEKQQQMRSQQHNSLQTPSQTKHGKGGKKDQKHRQARDWERLDITATTSMINISSFDYHNIFDRIKMNSLARPDYMTFDLLFRNNNSSSFYNNNALNQSSNPGEAAEMLLARMETQYATGRNRYAKPDTSSYLHVIRSWGENSRDATNTIHSGAVADGNAISIDTNEETNPIKGDVGITPPLTGNIATPSSVANRALEILNRMEYQYQIGNTSVNPYPYGYAIVIQVCSTIVSNNLNKTSDETNPSLSNNNVALQIAFDCYNRMISTNHLTTLEDGINTRSKYYGEIESNEHSDENHPDSNVYTCLLKCVANNLEDPEQRNKLAQRVLDAACEQGQMSNTVRKALCLASKEVYGAYIPSRSHSSHSSAQ